MNKVILMGRLTRDPELRYGQNELAITGITIAVDRKKEGTDFINCTAFGKTAEFISKYFNKGKKILVAGRIEVDNYEDDKGKHTVTKVIIEEVEFVEKKEQDEVINIPFDNELPLNTTSDDPDDDLPF